MIGRTFVPKLTPLMVRFIGKYKSTLKNITEEMRSCRVELLQGTIETTQNHYAPKMEQEVLSYDNESTSAIQAKLNDYDLHVARFDSGLDDCGDKIGQVLRMSSTLVHLEQFEKVLRQISFVESRL